MSGRPDRIISNACGFWGENVVGVGMSLRVRGDRACQSDWLTDGDRGHPQPSGAFYEFIKLLTPHHYAHRKCSGSWMERSCQWGGRGLREGWVMWSDEGRVVDELGGLGCRFRKESKLITQHFNLWTLKIHKLQLIQHELFYFLAKLEMKPSYLHL